jgi:hypothetical protein
MRICRCRTLSGTATTTNSANAAYNHISPDSRCNQASQMKHGTANIGVILAAHQRPAPHPGRSQTSLLTLRSANVAKAFEPRVRTITQLSKSTNVEWPNVIIQKACITTSLRARRPFLGSTPAGPRFRSKATQRAGTKCQVFATRSDYSLNKSAWVPVRTKTIVPLFPIASSRS